MFETDREPDHVNELGIKWWLEKNLTEYANNPDRRGTCLENVQCFIIEFPDGRKTRVLVEEGQVLYDDGSIEGIGTKIDMMKAAKRYADTK